MPESSLANFPRVEPVPASQALRLIAQTLDQLGVLVLHLAEEAESRGVLEEDPVMSVAEAAAELRCSRSQIQKECARKKIASWRNGAWYMRRSALRRYERSLTRGGQ